MSILTDPNYGGRPGYDAVVTKGNLAKGSDQMLPRKMQMSTSYNDHLRYEYAVAKEVPILLSLPFELLEPILDEVSINSISGLQAFARTSRICRALCRPYFSKTEDVTFEELIPNANSQNYVSVSLRELDNYKTLDIVNPLIHSCRDVPQATRSIQSVLGNQNNYRHVRYLAGSDINQIFSPAALDTINKACPLVSQITLGLPILDYFCYEDGSPRKKISLGWDTIVAISRFANLRHLELHFSVFDPWLQILYPQKGTQLARDLYTRIQGEGVCLDRIDVVFSTSSTNLFGNCSRIVPYDRVYVEVSVKMSCFSLAHSHQNPHENDTLHLACDLPIFGQILDRKKQANLLKARWEWTAGPRTWMHLEKEWPHPSRTSLFCAKLHTLPPMLLRYYTRPSTWKRGFQRVRRLVPKLQSNPV